MFHNILGLGETKNPQISLRASLVAGDQAISNFLEGYELVVDLWKYLNRRDG